MTKRNIWTREETQVLLNIMEENDYIQEFNSKKAKPNEIYKKIESQMRMRGFTAKGDTQIKFRWKNLKNIYISTKKLRTKGDMTGGTFPFYDELERILGAQGSINSIGRGVDICNDKNSSFEFGKSDQTTIELLKPLSPNSISTFKEGEWLEVFVSNSQHEQQPQNNVCKIDSIEFTPEPSSPKRLPKLATGKGSYFRCIEKLTDAIQLTQQEMNENFFAKQKELVDYEFSLYTKMEERFEEKFIESTNKMLEDNTKKFLSGLDNLFNNINSRDDSIPKLTNVIVPTTTSLNLRDFIANFPAN